MTSPGLSRRAGNLVFGGHLVLALEMAFWRTFESLPGWSARDGGSFTSSDAGRLLALATLVAGGLAALAVVLTTLRRWRDARVLLLFVLMLAAFVLHENVDVLDLVYAGSAIAFAAWWWRVERPALQPRA
ncbi:MAG: hypothetical protein IPJ19_01565 [Planctomycetes bacterium]|nr:hypothetical protein [Planctomycetota bacterium]